MANLIFGAAVVILTVFILSILFLFGGTNND